MNGSTIKTKQSKNKIENYLKNSLSIRKAPSSEYNYKMFKRSNTTRIDLERIHYEAELLYDEEEDSINMKNQVMFQRIDVSICKFLCHLFEPIDYLYLVIGLIGFLLCGASTPVLNYLNATVYSDVGNTSENRGSVSEEEMMKLNVKETMNKNIKQQIVCGCISLVGDLLGYYFVGLFSSRALYNFKKKYLRTILSQELGWFDSTNAYEFASKIQSQIEYIEFGIGEWLSNIIFDIINGAFSFIFAFFGSWKLSLVTLCFFPIVLILAIIYNKINIKGNSLVRQTWETAGGIGEEIFYNIKTVASFSNFEYELRRFYEKVEISNKIELKVNFKLRLMTGIFTFISVLIVFVSLIYGRVLIGKDFNSLRGRDLTGGDVTLTFFNMTGFLSAFIQVSINLQYLQLSLASTSDYFNLYERKPEMDLSNSLEKPPISDIKGKIEFNNVSFYYPSDLSKKLIINGINLNFESGKKIALIGESGCGKTTIVNLIERFYDVTDGEILLDGLDIRKYDIQYLRNLIGYVEQEPVLFNKTIRDNILFGRENYLKEKGEDIDKLIKNVCDESYVSEFINSLSNGLEYKVGTKGSKLSGGQKQRIAIARALLIKPKILILDEATSALDNKSEQIIQQALDNVTKMNITTIMIAHRLSTIKNSDIIYALKNGSVIEQGTHEELLNKGGYYTDIIRSQLIKEELENQNKKEEYIRKMTSIKRVNTDEEVHFERRDNEISKSPDDVSLSFCSIMKDLWNYKLYSIFALISLIIYGVFPPFRGLYQGKAINAINSKYETIRYDESLKYSVVYLILGFFYSLFHFLSLWFEYSLGINLSKMYRNKMMKKYLSFHLSFYDIDRNSPGSILTKMSINTIQLKEFLHFIVGYTIIIISNLIATLILGCCYEYRLTLISYFFLPFAIIINVIRRFAVQVDNKKSIEANMEGGSIISESVSNVKTIFAYNFQEEVLRIYTEVIGYITQNQIRDNFINGLVVGLNFFCDFANNIAIYAATKRYVLNDSMNTEDMAVVQNIVGSSFIFVLVLLRDLGHIKKAINAIKSIYSTLETESLIPPYAKDNINKISPENIRGKIEFKHVYFAYPTNPEHVILKDINMTIMPGQKVALVGYSGSGKSSIIQLLNRFYDIEDGKGEILIDDINIKDYNLYELRKKIGFVSQEPSIFKTALIENIRYGKLDASDNECIEAAREADSLNILEREEKGNKKKSALSGGQKQKIAIARVFLRNPIILLLDEATSALDKQSQIEVQNSLDKLSNNKTTISIAHRLSTIENSDKIFVFDKGRIHEQGTHEELMKLKKRYYTLQKYSSND